MAKIINLCHYRISDAHWKERGFSLAKNGREVIPESRKIGSQVEMSFGNARVVLPEKIIRQPFSLPLEALAGLQGFYLPPNIVGMYPTLPQFCDQSRLGALPTTLIEVRLLEKSWVPVKFIPFLGRKFELRVVSDSGYATTLARIIEGIAAISSSHYTDEAQLMSGFRHDLNNYLMVVNGRLELYYLASQDKVPPPWIKKAEEWVEFNAVPGLKARAMLIDDLVARRILGLFKINQTALKIVDALNNGKALPREKRFLQFPPIIKALNQLLSFIASTREALLDLSAKKIISRVSLREISTDQTSVGTALLESKVAVWIKSLPDDIQDLGIKGNLYLLRKVLNELFVNAERAAQVEFDDLKTGKELAFKYKISDDKKTLMLQVSNEVNDLNMKRALQEKADTWLDYTLDYHDYRRKQRLFLPGVTSKPYREITRAVGGLGLALTWEHVVRMGGKIRATYNRDNNMFTIKVYLPLADPYLGDR